MQQNVFDFFFFFWMFVHSVTLLKLYSQMQLFKLLGTATLDFFFFFPHLWCSSAVGCILDEDQLFVSLKTKSYWLGDFCGFLFFGFLFFFAKFSYKLNKLISAFLNFSMQLLLIFWCWEIQREILNWVWLFWKKKYLQYLCFWLITTMVLSNY